MWRDRNDFVYGLVIVVGLLGIAAEQNAHGEVASTASGCAAAVGIMATFSMLQASGCRLLAKGKEQQPLLSSPLSG